MSSATNCIKTVTIRRDNRYPAAENITVSGVHRKDGFDGPVLMRSPAIIESGWPSMGFERKLA
ncbi:MAG: hypothetical protein ACJAVZ_001969 [Afipia broomeae]|jgi:hypothetical protein|uniref:Uncharacterized protein n=1 Tax=Aurantiacibacter atlanticus TaxID=1648404 RepID=A0A168M5Y7_9SPHN|nr:hypothetical protein CP97_15031 [Aurantiacibacter atlanticus]